MFEFRGAKITARALTIGDDNAIDLLCFRLGDKTPMYSAQKWAEFLIAAVVDGEHPVPYADSTSTPEEARASFAAWTKLPRSFGQRWQSELQSADADPKA